MQELKFTIAKNIQALRQKSEMTQADLAKELNYSDKAVSKWERGDSLPDITVLKKIADLFDVSLDYLVEAEHKETSCGSMQEDRSLKSGQGFGQQFRQKRNYYIITVTSISIVLIIATLLYIILTMVYPGTAYPWLCYAYAIPSSMVVWLVFNSIWFDPHYNFRIVSLLIWSLLGALYFTFLLRGYRIWPVILLGIPIQVIIWMWSNLKKKR